MLGVGILIGIAVGVVLGFFGALALSAWVGTWVDMPGHKGGLK